VLVEWVRSVPAAPVLPAHLAPEGPVARALIENYRALSDVATERATKLFDLIVVKALLPVFTAIVGYLLGSRAGAGKEG